MFPYGNRIHLFIGSVGRLAGRFRATCSTEPITRTGSVSVTNIGDQRERSREYRADIWASGPHHRDAPASLGARAEANGRPPVPHPALVSRREIPQPLVLVLPDELGETEFLRGVISAVQRFRDALATRVTRFEEAAERAHADGDPIRQALFRGQALACSDAIASVDENLVEAFNLWNQYTAQTEPPQGGPG